MSSDARKLFDLQQIDLAHRKKKKRLDEIARQLANHAPVKKAQAQVAAAEDALKPLQTDLRDLELQVQTTRQKSESSTQRLYSGAVSNPKELQDIEQNIASLKRRQTELEDHQLELMMAVESAQDTLEASKANLETVMAETAISSEDLIAEKEMLESGIVELKQDREDLIDRINAGDLALYEDLQPKMNFRPIAQLVDDQNCSVCGVQQTGIHAQHIRQSDELSRCASCNRILIAI